MNKKLKVIGIISLIVIVLLVIVAIASASLAIGMVYAVIKIFVSIWTAFTDFWYGNGGY